MDFFVNGFYTIFQNYDSVSPKESISCSILNANVGD